MANETKIGKLVIDLQIKTQALEKGLETAKKKLESIEQENKKIQSSNSQLNASFIAMSATAVATLVKISGAIKDCINEYNAYTQAMSSLENVSEYTGESMSDLSDIMDKYSSYMTKSDLATTIKNFSLMGFTAEQTSQMIESLTNSAIRNRNANYTVSEAVRVASEGYRQGLSTLSDSAGVTENLSVMLDNYARSIGKTASQLTEAEKNQAYLNRTMYAAEPFAGAMEDYLENLAGKQGQYSQALRETQLAYTEALEPTLIKMEEMKTNAIKTLGNLISEHESATTAITTFSIVLLGLGATFTIGVKGVQMYKTAIDTLNISAKSLKVTMGSMLIFSAVIAGITALSSAEKENEEATKRLEEATKRYSEVKNETFAYTEKNVSQLERDKETIEEQIELLQKKMELEEKIKNVQDNDDYYVYANGNGYSAMYDTSEMAKYQKELDEINKQYKESIKNSTNWGNSLDELRQSQANNTEALKKASAIKNIAKAFDTSAIRQQQQKAAQLKINANQMKDYLNIVKAGNKNTQQYQDAVTALAKAYPEASTNGGLLINVLEGLISAEQLQADEAWNASQASIQGHIQNIQQALNDGNVQRQVATNMGIAYDQNFKPKLEAILSLLQMIGGYTPTEVPNITPSSVSRKSYSSSSKSYSNKALDNYKKEIEYKKSLDQLSLQQEIAMYETALRKYARTIDEKRELRTKIYELNKELAQKEKELLEQQTEDYETYMQEQKNLRGAAYDVSEQTRDYDKIIQMHRKYLNQIMKDERLSLEERKEIYREELATIRDYEQQKRDLRVESIDNTVTQLKNAITKQLEEMQEKDKEYIDNQIEEIERLKEIRINAINAEYDAKIEAIEKELEALDKAEQQKSRDEEDAEYESKKKRLEKLVAFEHDSTTKANYQKELDKLIAEYQKTLDKRALEDKKEALNEQKDLLQKEQDEKTQLIEDEVEKQKEIYNKQLEELDKYYSEQMDKAQETAEKMLLNVDQNQKQILNLLKNYGDAYEITGQSLGEKLAQGINNGLSNKIQNIIQKIQDTIDANIESQIAKMASSVYKYEAGANKPQTATKTITINQTNNIQQNPEMPSETYRKLRNIDEELASSLAGV